MRVVAIEVKQIMDGCTLDDQVVDAYIVAANELVDKVFENDTDIGDTLLKEIEKWLTAHLIASSQQRTAAMEAVGDARIAYTGEWGKRLESTPYGQVALTLDITGKLARAGKTAASIRAVESFE